MTRTPPSGGLPGGGAPAASAPAADAPEVLRTRGARHWGGFLVSGGIAFAVDAGVLALLTRGLGVDSYSARVVAIACAMVAGWLLHRRLTFAVPAPPSLTELLRYAALQWASVATNYGFYAALLALLPRLDPLLALFAASVVAMAVSYAGMRFGVFRAPPNP